MFLATFKVAIALRVCGLAIQGGNRYKVMVEPQKRNQLTCMNGQVVRMYGSSAHRYRFQCVRERKGYVKNWVVYPPTIWSIISNTFKIPTRIPSYLQVQWVPAPHIREPLYSSPVAQEATHQ